MKKLVFILLLLTVSGLVYSQTIRDRIRERQSSKSNKEETKTIAPDYSNLFFWAAHPQKKDMSDSMAAFLSNETRDTLADVFFLHPTTYTKNGAESMWNADLMDTALNNSTDSRPILFQSSVFNNCSRIFAPRYRQAHLKAYLDMQSDASQKAFDLAYEDLKNAFQYYLDHWNHGRPIIIASHSQGAMHAVRLIQEFFDGKPLQKQLVCAYIVGWQIKEEDFKELKVCESPEATGCFVGWRSFRKGEIDLMVDKENGNSICVNPISWTTSSAIATKEQHKGMVGRDFNKVYRNFISASIEPDHKVLWVELPPILSDQFGNMKNYHIADYNLFYLDIRENAKQRVKAFLGKK